ncbi:MAG: hypothetical protein KAS72_13920 [Phycisphaerales bacterium]|nr:hypothetical protein [Phycisphaerales bacterium]
MPTHTHAPEQKLSRTRRSFQPALSGLPANRNIHIEPLEDRRLLAGLTIVTHGLLFVDELPSWVDHMASAVVDRIQQETGFDNDQIPTSTIIVTEDGGDLSVINTGLDIAQSQWHSGEIVLKLDWSAIASFFESTTGTIAEAVVSELLDPSFFSTFGTSVLSLPIHLIGHSRGGSLVAAIAENLGEAGAWVDHVTFLDPHPMPGDYGYIAGLSPTENVVFSDNYYQHLSPSAYWGYPHEGTFNRELTNLDDGYGPDGWLWHEHSDVHLWYHGTIDHDSNVWDGDEWLTNDMRDDWYGSGEGAGSTAGYYYSRVSNINGGGGSRLSYDQPGGSDDRIRDGLHGALGGSRSENDQKDIDWSNATWPNILSLDIDGGYSHQIGETVTFQYEYNDYDDATTIIIRVDNDLNPYNGCGAMVTWAHHSVVTGETVVDAPIEWDTAGYNPAPDGLWVFAEITDGDGHTRYLYAPQKLILTPTNPQEGDALRFASPDGLDWGPTENGDDITETQEWSRLDITLINIGSEQARDVQGWMSADSPVVQDIQPTLNFWDDISPGGEDRVSDHDEWTIDVGGFATTTVTFTLHLTYWQGSTFYSQDLAFDKTFYQQGQPAAKPHFEYWFWHEDEENVGNDFNDNCESGEYGDLWIHLENHGDEKINNLEMWLETAETGVDLTFYKDGGNTILPGDSLEASWAFHPLRWFQGDVEITLYMRWNVGNGSEWYDNFDDPDTFVVHVDPAAWLEIGADPEADPPLHDNTVDFGPATPGEIIEWSFFVWNMGTETLTITGVEVSDPDRITWQDDGSLWGVAPGYENRVYFTLFIDTTDYIGDFDGTLQILSNGWFENLYYEEDTLLLHALVNPAIPFYDVPDVTGAREPDISGDWIGWWENRSGQEDIFAYQISTGTEVRITDDECQQWPPRLFGDLIVWEDRRNDPDDEYVNRDIYGYDLGNPGLGVFAVSSDLAWDEHLVGVDSDGTGAVLVAFARDYEILYDSGERDETARNLVVYEYLGAGQFGERYSTNWQPGTGHSSRPTVDPIGDFGGALLVFQREDIVWNDGHQSWEIANSRMEAMNFVVGDDAPWPTVISSQASLLGAAEGHCVFDDYGDNGKIQVHYWHASGDWVEELTDAEHGVASDALAVGGTLGAQIAIYDYRRSVDYPGLYYMDIATGRKGVITTESNPIEARMDGNSAVWVDVETGFGVRYAYLKQADLVVTPDDITVSPTEPMQHEPFHVEVVVRNIGAFDLEEDASIHLYDGDPDQPGWQLLGSDTIPAGDLPANGQATVTFEGAVIETSGWHELYVKVEPASEHEATSNNTAMRNLYVFDDDAVGPWIADVVIDDEEGNGDGISPDEGIVASWLISDGSGVDPNSVECEVDGQPVAFNDHGDGMYSTVVFGPLAIGPHELIIRATDMDDTPASSAYLMPFEVVEAERIEVWYNGSPLVGNLDFGEVVVPGTRQLELEIRNVGGEPLTIYSALGLEAPFSLDPENGEGSGDDWVIAGGGDPQLITITFAPGALVVFSDTLNLDTSAAVDATVDVTGVGVNEPQVNLRGISLVVTPGQLPTSGGPVQYPWTVENNGPNDITGPINVCFYLSDDATINQDDEEIASHLIETGLAAGASYTPSDPTYSVPALPEGDYWIGMIIDPQNTIQETDDTDNSNRGDSIDRGRFDVVGTAPEFVYEYTNHGESATVAIFDATNSTPDFLEEMVKVKWGGKNNPEKVRFIKIKRGFTGMGILIDDASIVKRIVDRRKPRNLTNLAFIVSNTTIEQLRLKSGLTGHELDGVKLTTNNGFETTLPPDIDDDPERQGKAAVYMGGEDGITRRLKLNGNLWGDIIARDTIVNRLIVKGTTQGAMIRVHEFGPRLVMAGNVWPWFNTYLVTEQAPMVAKIKWAGSMHTIKQVDFFKRSSYVGADHIVVTQI